MSSSDLIDVPLLFPIHRVTAEEQEAFDRALANGFPRLDPLLWEGDQA